MAKAKKATDESCDCLEQCQKKLKPHGVQLKTELLVNFKTGSVSSFGPFLAISRTGKPEKGFKKVSSLACTYCPFCGKKVSK